MITIRASWKQVAWIKDKISSIKGQNMIDSDKVYWVRSLNRERMAPTCNIISYQKLSPSRTHIRAGVVDAVGKISAF